MKAEMTKKMPVISLLPDVLPENINLLVLSRLFVFAALTLTCLLFLWLDSFTFYLLVGYTVSVLVFLEVVVRGKSVMPQWLVKSILSFHILLELAVEAAIVGHSGGIQSPFSLFLVVSIASAALIYQLKTSMLAAVIGSLFYLVTALGSVFERVLALPTPSSLSLLYRVAPGDFYALGLNILLFLMIAFNVGYLVERSRRKARESSTAWEPQTYLGVRIEASAG
jgi:hypothetical protein